MSNKSQTFEEYLSEKCDTHTNNDPAGFETWLEQLDGEQYMEYAEEWCQQEKFILQRDLTDMFKNQ